MQHKQSFRIWSLQDPRPQALTEQKIDGNCRKARRTRSARCSRTITATKLSEVNGAMDRYLKRRISLGSTVYVVSKGPARQNMAFLNRAITAANPHWNSLPKAHGLKSSQMASFMHLFVSAYPKKCLLFPPRLPGAFNFRFPLGRPLVAAGRTLLAVDVLTGAKGAS